ncbi:hypothetical protein OG21DRAFT_1479644 [Imleria badia]|nr:hypothetical protein OG21DRAFT_1479644 [Imleria badia]
MSRSQNLSGFSIPGTTTNICINLYADDTTVYLSEMDKYELLQTILLHWCHASGTKFNIEKTEILPIRSQEHHNIMIAADGHPICCLGVWIGNKVNQAQPWNPIIDKIKHSLDQWNINNPTLDAKRLIVQMTISIMTQFLTCTQGMPKSISKALTKLTRDFIWNGKKSPLLSLKRL